jgi:hypothetical protein
MSEWETVGQGGATESVDEDDELGGPGNDDEPGWDETNDEPAEGEQGQDAV